MSSAQAEAATSAAEDMRSEKKWRRHSLWALAVLLPAALVVMTYSNVVELLHKNDLVPSDAAAGTDVAFGGSTWRLEKLRTAEGVDPKRLPANAVPVLADFAVKIGDPDLENLWLGCKITLTDATGRLWAPTSIMVISTSDDFKTCNSAIFSGAKSGDVLKIREMFVIPRDTAAFIRANVGLSSERPYYLRFGRPED
jgi:hypothetical protein